MSDDMKFYDQELFEGYDTQSGNNLCVKLSASKNEYGIKPVKIQLQITNRKSRIFTFVSLSYQQLFLHLLKMKSHVENGKYQALLKKIKNNWNCKSKSKN